MDLSFYKSSLAAGVEQMNDEIVEVRQTYPKTSQAFDSKFGCTVSRGTMNSFYGINRFGEEITVM